MTMANGVGRALAITVVALVLLLGFAAAASDNAFLVVHRDARISKGKAKSERVSVAITIFNAGSSTAYDVALKDDTWPEDRFNVVSRNFSVTWDKLDAGGLVSHEFVLEPKVKGPFTGGPAVVKYRVAAKSRLQEAWSTVITDLDVLSDKPAQNKLDLIKRLGVAYGPLATVIGVVGLFAYVLISPSKSKKFSAKKRR